VIKKILTLMLLLNIAILAHSENDEIRGVVINSEDGKSIADAVVEFGVFKGSWKIWTLPDYKVLGKAVTDRNGVFVFQLKKRQKEVVVNLKMDICWKPYSKTIKLADLSGEAVLKIETSRAGYLDCE
jgi:hypothetical protein